MGKARVWVKKILMGMDRIWVKKILMGIGIKISPPYPNLPYPMTALIDT
jgi:hypothetical protein